MLERRIQITRIPPQDSDILYDMKCGVNMKS